MNNMISVEELISRFELERDMINLDIDDCEDYEFDLSDNDFIYQDEDDDEDDDENDEY